MIISIFVLDLHRNTKLYRSSAPMSSSKMNYYLTEFTSFTPEGDGLVERDTYNYVYISNNVQRIAMQTTKEHSVKQAQQLLKHIEQNSTEDIFDMLFTIDSTLFGGVGVKLDIPTIKEMDSQDEKIHKMVLENRRQEMAQREREQRMQYAREAPVAEEAPTPVMKPKKMEKSAQPVLLIIREKVKVEIDRDNKIKDSSLNGEVDLVISDAKYRQLQVKMHNLKSSLKYSPYLDKNALRKQVLRFEKDRGLNKNIPLLKWNGRCEKLPVLFEFWSDEDEGKIVNTVGFKAMRDIKEIELRFNKESASDIEVDNEYEEEGDFIIWKAYNIKKDDSRNVEVRCVAFDKDCLFPIEVKLLTNEVETNIDVDKMMVEDNEIEEYEVRKIYETEDFIISLE